MKNRVFKIFIASLLLFTGLTLYTNSSYYIQNQDWKYSNGTHIGDWLGKKDFKIKDRVIYSNNEDAKIVFSFGKGLIIKNTKTGERGFYVNKN